MPSDARQKDPNFPLAPMRVLVVDDQSFMRIALRKILEAEDDIRVVGEAQNGAEAVALARELKPDAITLDVEMPEMDGLEACSQIVRAVTPRPTIIMVSAHTQVGAEAAVKALRLGAVDFVSKSSTFARTDLAHINSELPPKLRAWVKRQPLAQTGATLAKTAIRVSPRYVDLVVIAASTGGPQALTTLLSALGSIRPPIVICQHMPEFFTASLAEMLSRDTGVEVREGSNRFLLPPHSVTLVPGSRDGVIAPHRPGGYELRLINVDSNVHPSADALFASAALVSSSPVGVVLTGMGEDGAKGSVALRRKGAPVLVQDPGSCVVNGMPQAAFAAAPGCEVLSIEGIADTLVAWSLFDTGASAT